MLVNKYIKAVFVGVGGASAMFFLYWFLIFIVSKDPMQAFDQFEQFKYWMSALILGFGTQTALFWYIRSGSHLVGSSIVATSASTSTVAMVACCAHRLVDFLPILGLSGAALFLIDYQEYFFSLGIISNLFGIAMMLYIIKTKQSITFWQFIKKILFFKK